MHSNTVFFLRLVSATPTRYGENKAVIAPRGLACSLRCITGGGATMMKTDYFKRAGGLILGLF